MAVTWARAAAGPDAAAALGRRLDPRAPQVLALAERHDVLRTTSAGRLFDAVAAIVGIRGRVSYEGQAAVELEALAATVPPGDAVPYRADVDMTDGMLVLDPAPMIGAVLDDVARGRPPAAVAAGFHLGLAAAVASAATDLAGRHGVGTVALSGGVFQNVVLSRAVEVALAGAGLEVLVHRHVPPNDGGISVGQAAVAAAASRR
jgi:hydrogenase maturation protein HypF